MKNRFRDLYSISILDTIKMSQISHNEFECALCNYTTCKKSDYAKHIATRKHLLLANTKNTTTKNTTTKNNTTNSISEHKLHPCSCGKEYKFSSSLSFHKKTCLKIIYQRSRNKLKLLSFIVRIKFVNIFCFFSFFC